MLETASNTSEVMHLTAVSFRVLWVENVRGSLSYKAVRKVEGNELKQEQVI